MRGKKITNSGTIFVWQKLDAFVKNGSGRVIGLNEIKPETQKSAQTGGEKTWGDRARI